MLKIKITDDKGITTYRTVSDITDSVRESAMAKFKNEKERGVILNDSFSDQVWTITDQKHRVHFSFNIMEDDVRKICLEQGTSYLTFINDLKTFVMLRHGTVDLDQLRSFIRYVVTEACRSSFFTVLLPPHETKYEKHLRFYVEFLRILRYVPRAYFDMCESVFVVHGKKKSKNDRQVTLNEFESYFHLNDVVNEYFENESDTAWKWYLYPFYMYWRITTVLPMRVTEFCLTPYDCISNDGGVYTLTVRRSVLKGSSTFDPKIHFYTLDDDYEICTYEIPESIFRMVHLYQSRTARFAHPHSLLFSVDYSLSFGVGTMRTRMTNKVFLGNELRNVMDDFYDHVVCGMYGLRLVDAEALLNRSYSDDYGIYEMKDDEIMKIELRHTRHLAMINLVCHGVNPVIIKDFAGHASTESAAHYYANIDKLVRCRVKNYRDRAKKNRSAAGDVDPFPGMDPLSIRVTSRGKYMETDVGKCYSARALKDDPGDCERVDYDCGNCRFGDISKKKLDKYKQKTKELELRVDKEMLIFQKFLSSPDLDNQVRAYQEEAQRLMSDLQNLSLRYFKEFEMQDNED